MSLAAKRILVVRPKPLPQLGVDQFVAQLSATGALPLHLPVMHIDPYTVPLSDQPASERIERIKTSMMSLANFQTVIFVSRPAALLGADWIDHYWPQLPMGVQFFAVGSSTRQVLADQGINAQAPHQQQTTEGLLTLPELQQLQGNKVLICKGEGGRELLADELQQRGAEVEELNLYRRNLCADHQQDITNALQRGLDAVVVHSVQLLQGLLNQVPKALHSVLFTRTVIVPSARVAEAASGEGFANVEIANSAMPEDMVSVLRRCYING